MDSPAGPFTSADLASPNHHTNASQLASFLKRKRAADYGDGPDKRIKAGEDAFTGFPPCRGLPAELWQHIFMYLSPPQLGQLLSINKAFNLYLTDSQRWQECRRSPVPVRTSHKLVDPQSIWVQARKTFNPSIPKPLIGCTELEMWKLLKGKRCQFCGRSRSKSRPAGSAWERGPGESGVRAIWPFAVLCCGSCLRSHSESVLLSTASAFRKVLPFAIVTDYMHWIPTVALKNSVPLQDLNTSKIFLINHIENLQQSVAEVRNLGTPAAEEWFKGQEAHCQEKWNDVMRWERWEHEGGYERMNSLPNSPTSKVATHVYGQSGMQTPVQSSMNRPPGAQTHHSMSRPSSIAGAQGLFHQPRSERVLQEANEVKAVRKAEIERRCSELIPPIPPKILQHMESFKAAIQIGTVLTENAWEMLKPRIIAQKAAAEQLEEEKVADHRAQQAKSEERRQQDATTRATIEAFDREWEEAQAPIREKLGEYAEESISNTWADGTSINWESCPQFAADVLLYVRRRFHSDLAKDDAATVVSGQDIEHDSGTALPPRILTLENMKWVYETKIKPLTDRFRRELFLCNGCDNLSKLYAFDGVIQHYAAKHTNNFSVGHSSVHWKTAEWPEIPPFVPDPNSRKLDMLAMANTGNALPAQATNQGQVFPYGPTPMSATRPQAVQNLVMSPTPYGNMAYPNQLSMTQYGPYGPPVSFFGQPVMQQSFSPPYADQVRFKPPGNPYPSQYSGQPIFMGQTSLTPTQPQVAWPPPDSGTFVAARGTVSVQHGYGQNRSMEGSTGSVSLSTNQPYINLYESQKEYVADVAKYVWNHTSGIVGMLPSVRIYTVIHQVISQFRIQFSNEPNLDLFSDALLNHPLMTPIKNTDGLACKTCVLRKDERMIYAFHSLLVHFKNSHVEQFTSHKGRDALRLDWKEDMIEMPPPSLISGLANAAGMDSKKLKFFAEVFPEHLADHVLRIPMAPDEAFEGPNPPRRILPSHGRFEGAYSPDSERKLRDTTGKARITRPVSSSSREQPSPANDEYDPRRPAFLDPRKDPSFVPSRISHRSEGGLEGDGPSPSQQSQTVPSRQASKASQISHPFRASGTTSHDGIVSEDGELPESRWRTLHGSSNLNRTYSPGPRNAGQLSPDEQANRFLEDYDFDPNTHARVQHFARRYSPSEYRKIYRPVEDGFIALDDNDPYARHPVVFGPGRGPSRISDRPSYVKVEEVAHGLRYYDHATDEPVQFIRIDRGSSVPEKFSDGNLEYFPIVRSSSRQPPRNSRTGEYVLMPREVSRQQLRNYESEMDEERLPLGEAHRQG